MLTMNVALIGAGNISGIYLSNLGTRFPAVRVIGVCDLIREKAEAAAGQFGVQIYDDMHAAFADPAVDAIVNLTRPHQHYDVTRQALIAGKHVYSEKPLAAAIEQGRELVALAAEKGLYLGGAPDTFLGDGIQTCRALIERGEIGRPVAATAFMTGHGPESWHPDPAFFYQFGGGPMMDMGPYYVSALVELMGRVRSVMGMAETSFAERTMTCKEHFGEVIRPEVATHVGGLMRFESGAIATIVTSFDVWAAQLPRIEIYGELGTLSAPDPNTFRGPVLLYKPEWGEFREQPLLSTEFSENCRGLGIDGMAAAIAANRPDFACSHRRTFHVLDVMTGFVRSSRSGAAVEMA
ncbi:MAG: Gfo/Idh/MocA family oxidoreductase [Clostridiales bacterium]|nr:Gfo/Idh/MocA family oxidoreductase [Clostridiales bacterium]